MTHCKRLYILEGPDGAGKTTLAQQLADKLAARYVHFGPLRELNGPQVACEYVSQMMPALEGIADVIFDRSWLSERPYGTAFRAGEDRLGDATRRMLERLAWRCGAVVIKCQPDWEVVKRNWLSRPDDEMLDTPAQLRQVYDLYLEEPTSLPYLLYDYTAGMLTELREALTIMNYVQPPHPLAVRSAGDWDAPIVLVGEGFARRKAVDHEYQWPFASFSQEGCSQWLTAQLQAGGIGEDDLLWVNADQDLSLIDWQGCHVVALGLSAFEALSKLKVGCHKTIHPQAWKRFHANEPYPLVGLLRTMLATEGA